MGERRRKIADSTVEGCVGHSAERESARLRGRLYVSLRASRAVRSSGHLRTWRGLGMTRFVASTAVLLDAAFGRVVRHARNVIVMRVWLAGHVESRRGPYTWPSQRGPSAAAE
jgi:hypothetical protein